MYSLARILGTHPAIAAWSGLLFAMSGGLMARVHAGHLEKVLAIPYIPLVFACALLSARANSLKGVAFWAALAGTFNGFTFLAGETFLQTYLFVAVVIIFLFGTKIGRDTKPFRRMLVGLGAWATGTAIATAGKLIASIVVLADTVREAKPFIGSQDAPWAFVHLAFPFFGSVPGLENFSYGANQQYWIWGMWEFTQYVSFVPVLLAGMTAVLVVPGPGRWPQSAICTLRRRDVWALVGVCILGALWLANGQWYSPVRWLYEIVTPLQNFRVPSRGLMLTAPAVLALAALGLEALRTARSPKKQATAYAILVTAIGASVWFNASWFKPCKWIIDSFPVLNFVSIPVCIGLSIALAIVALVASLLIARRLSVQRQQQAFLLALSLIATIALGDVYHAARETPEVHETRYTASIRKVIDRLQTLDDGPFLVELGYINKGFYGRSGAYINKAIRFEFAEKGIAVSENVTPLLPKQQIQHEVLDLNRRVRYRVVPASEPLPVSEKWTDLLEEGNVAVQVNKNAQGDVWLIHDGNVEDLRIDDFKPGEFTVRATAQLGDTLVVPANAFQGWQVSIDGSPYRDSIEFDGFAAATTYAGEHTYKFAYKQPLLPLILVLGALPWILLTGFLLWLLISFIVVKTSVASMPGTRAT